MPAGMPTGHRQVSRRKHDRPPSLQRFMADFADDASAAWLAQRRWPNSFVYPACGSKRARRLETNAWTRQRAGCGRHPATAGAIMRQPSLPAAANLGPGHPTWRRPTRTETWRRQVQAKLEIGAYKAARPLLHKSRRSTVDPERDPLAGMVERPASSIARTAIPSPRTPAAATTASGSSPARSNAKLTRADGLVRLSVNGLSPLLPQSHVAPVSNFLQPHIFLLWARRSGTRRGGVR